ncbi:MAG: sn-glycerol-3-phosphate ABC transporter ATP-binding protein UgpC [Myxococcales bacterium]|nr:sn-glycerol-3-phosphate ABC transporter ATP-binding protein UgpC [Myxococcales bacterium]
MAAVTLRALRKTLGENAILRGIDLHLNDGEFVVLVGPSGCGKSTLLRTLAGLEEPDSGQVLLGDRDVTLRPPRDRDVAMVFQSYALYPHLTVRENLAFGLRLRKTPEAEIARRVARVAEMLSIASLLDRLPKDMSGGQRQRVAMGRAIAREPSVFLFDEPLSNLDAALRAQVRVEIKKVHQTLKTTMIYVTHDQVEAMTLADRLVVLSAGTVEQEGPPLEVYRRPASMFVASFLGSPAMNFVAATVAPDLARVTAEGLSLGFDAARFRGKVSAGQSVMVGVRPHDVSRRPDGGLRFTVDVVEPMGFEAYAHGRVGETPFVMRLDGHDALPAPGDQLSAAADVDSVHIFDPVTRKALG